LTSWGEFESQAPDFGLAARRTFSPPGCEGLLYGFLASASERGVPHLSPVNPVLYEGELYVFTPEGVPKIHDLRSSGRYVLHAFLSIDQPNPDAGVTPNFEEFRISGRAVEVHDSAMRSAVQETFSPAVPRDHGLPPMFRLLVERATWKYSERAGVQERWVTVVKRWPQS